MDASDIKVSTNVDKDTAYVIIKWPTGDMTILMKPTDQLESVQMMGIKDPLLKQMRPLIGTYE